MFHFGPATAHFGPSPWVTRALPSGSLAKNSFMKPGGVTRPPPPTVITEDAAGMTDRRVEDGPCVHEDPQLLDLVAVEADDVGTGEGDGAAVLAPVHDIHLDEHGVADLRQRLDVVVKGVDAREERRHRLFDRRLVETGLAVTELVHRLVGEEADEPCRVERLAPCEEAHDRLCHHARDPLRHLI